jgi:hypothetical protein
VHKFCTLISGEVGGFEGRMRMSKDLLLTCVDKLQAKMKQSLMDVASTHNQQVLIVKLSHFYSLENRFKNWILLNWAFSK